MKTPLRIALYYLIFGILWILLSDWYAAAVAKEAAGLLLAEVFKGSLFVLCSTLVVFYLVQRATQEIRRQEEARQRELRETISKAHHILLNYLNQMELVALEAEDCPDFNRDTILLARRISREAAQELEILGAACQANPLPEKPTPSTN